MPARIFLASAWALEMSLVQMPAPRPYWVSLADGGDLVQVGERGSDQHRTEDLLADDRHVRVRIGEHGGLDEVAAIAVAPAAGQGGGAFGYAGVDKAGHAAQSKVASS